jgi:hypothetical protein
VEVGFAGAAEGEGLVGDGDEDRRHEGEIMKYEV